MRKRFATLGVVSVATLLFLYLPILILIVFSLNKSRYTAGWEGWTWDWYSKLWHNRNILRSTANSLWIGLFSSAVATLLGTAAAVAQGRFKFKRGAWLEAVFFLPLIIPELMLAVGFLLFFSLLRWKTGLLTLMLGHATFNIPIVWLMVRSRLKKLDPRLEEAAIDLGATPWTAFLKVTLPLLMPAVAGGALMAFAISLDDFIISFFIAGPDSTTLPVQIYSMLKFSISPEVNALSTLLFLASMSLVVLAWALQKEEATS